METKRRSRAGRFLNIVLIIGICGTATLIWTKRHHFDQVTTAIEVKAVDAQERKEPSVPEGWKRLDIKDKVSLTIPDNMKQIEPVGDADWYREAHANRDIHLTVVYGYIIAPNPNRPDPLATCETSRGLREKPSYTEAVVEIDRKKATVSSYEFGEHQVSVMVCFPKTVDTPIPLHIVAYCRDNRGFETAQQIFRSIRFK